MVDAAPGAAAATQAQPAAGVRVCRIAEKHSRATWGAVNQVLHHEPQLFVRTPGLTYVDKNRGTRAQTEALKAQKSTKLFFFMKDLHQICNDRIVRETKNCVTNMPEQPGLIGLLVIWFL